jgi:hypothetical protein
MAGEPEATSAGFAAQGWDWRDDAPIHQALQNAADRRGRGRDPFAGEQDDDLRGVYVGIAAGCVGFPPILTGAFPNDPAPTWQAARTDILRASIGGEANDGEKRPA